MILPCPACQARFMVPDERVTPTGIKIRCPKCRFVFIMKSSGASGGKAAPRQRPAAAGQIGAPAPPPKKRKKKRRAGPRLPETTAEQLSAEEMAHLESDEIMDMDDLAQVSEQSGMAVKEDTREDPLEKQDDSGPSVVIDDSLFAAAAAYSAATEQLPTPAAAAGVSDTWITTAGPDFHTEEPTEPGIKPQGVVVPPAPPTPAVPPLAKAAQAGEIGAAAPPPTPDAGLVDVDIDVEPPVEIPEAIAGVDIDIEEPVEIPEVPAEEIPEEGMAVGGSAADTWIVPAYTLTAAATIPPGMLDAMPEFEGLLVEEKRALRKGPAAIFLIIVAIIGGLSIAGLIGYLVYLRLNPEKVKPPSWAHLHLSELKHNLVESKDGVPVVRIHVRVNNGSKKARFRNVHIRAAILSGSGETRCENWAPCGPVFSRREIKEISRRTYRKDLKRKRMETPYLVQLNPGQNERCQVLLFCGRQYQVGSDRVKVQLDKERSERIIE